MSQYWEANDIVTIYTLGKSLETLFCTLLVYEDDFSKTLSSKVSQSVLMCSLLEGTVRGVKAVSLQTQMIMLCPTVVTKHKRFGDDALWRVYSNELIDLSKGKFVAFPDGDVALIVCNVLLFGADTPASGRALGLLPSTPCRFCLVPQVRLGACVDVKNIQKRKREDIVAAITANDGHHGRPQSNFANTFLERVGLKRLSPMIVEWPNFTDTDRFVVDIMHAVCEGSCFALWCALIFDMCTILLQYS